MRVDDRLDQLMRYAAMNRTAIISSLQAIRTAIEDAHDGNCDADLIPNYKGGIRLCDELIAKVASAVKLTSEELLQSFDRYVSDCLPWTDNILHTIRQETKNIRNELKDSQNASRFVSDDVKVISIWLTDPIGGTYVNEWPENVDQSYFNSNCWSSDFWNSNALAHLELKLIPRLRSEDLLWVDNNSLEAFESEIDLVATNSKLVALECDIQIDSVNQFLARLKNAVSFAKNVADAGICIT